MNTYIQQRCNKLIEMFIWANLHIISEGLCGTKDCSNDTENSDLPGIDNILENIQIFLNCKNVSQSYCFHCIFDLKPQTFEL